MQALEGSSCGWKVSRRKEKWKGNSTATDAAKSKRNGVRGDEGNELFQEERLSTLVETELS